MHIILKQGLTQNLKLNQVIELSNLIAFPDEVLNRVADEITHNPDSVEGRLKKLREDKTVKYVDDKVRALFPSLVPSQGDPDDGRKAGLVIAPDIRILEDSLGQHQVQITPDVTYVGRTSGKPELVYSDHLKGVMALSLVQLDQVRYPETSRLLNYLRKFDEWKRKTLRDSYLAIGEVQREFFENLDKTAFHLFKQDDLAERLNFSTSTISRILTNRYIEARGVNEKKEIWRSKDLLVTADRLLRYSIIPLINAVFEKEFSEKMAYSDQDIQKMVPNIARRTLAKYRVEARIPEHGGRIKIYRAGERKEPFKIE